MSSISLPNNHEIAAAEAALNTLRGTLRSAKRGAVGPEAEAALRTLNVTMSACSVAVDQIRKFSAYNHRIEAITREFDRLARNGQDLASDLGVGAKYRGLRKGGMTTQQKSEFISQHGAEAYENLPL